MSPASIAAPTLGRLVRVELRKSIDTRAGRWLLGVLAVVSIGGVVLVLVFGDASSQDFSDFLFTAQLPMGLLLPVVGILAMTSEWSQRTALTTFAMVPHRTRVLTAKLMGLISLALALVVASVVTAAVAAAIAAASGSAHSAPLLETVGRSVLFECLVIVVGAAFGLALLNAPAALVAFFLLPTALTALVSLIAPLRDPVHWLDLVANTTHLLGDDLTGAVWAKMAVSVAVWGVLPLAIGTIRVQRRDIT